MNLRLRVEKSFGNLRFYPMNTSKEAILFLKLLKQSSFTLDQIKIIKSLGYDMVYMPTEIQVDDAS